MTGGADQKRLREAVLLGAVALIALAIAIALVVTSAVTQPAVDRQGRVLPGFAGPADADLAERVLTSLGDLEFVGARTRSRGRHADLGLVDPRHGGEATRITVRDYDDAVMADLFLGAARGENGVYLRVPDEEQTYAADGAPAIAEEASRWMSLDFLALGVDSLARVHVQPERGPAYRLERPGISVRNFALRFPPGWQPVTDGAGNGTGSVLGRVRFRDVRGATFGEPPVATHAAETFGGLRVEISVFALAGERWATIRAIALTDDAEAEALALNNASDGWAFLLSDLTVERLIRPLEDFAIRTPTRDPVESETPR